ncbi:ATP-dependent Clp protease proteolytic subunit, partial [Lacticaseibacillus paracasei]
MVHNPIYTFFGASLNADEMDKFANELRVFKEGLLNAYETRTGLSREMLSAMLDAETWMTAQKAVELGFA